MKGRRRKRLRCNKGGRFGGGKAKEHFEKTLDSYKQGKVPAAD
jgi:hypothetical protein